MAELILRDEDGHEVGRRSMPPDERLFFYQAYQTNDLISFDGKRYRIKTVAWLVPEHDLVLGVRFDSWAPYCDD
jgi:hypothetical protein